MSTVDLGQASSLVGMGSVQRFARDEVYFEDKSGNGWLQSGFISQDFAAFPDAHVHKTLHFESAGLGIGRAAYSPSLKLWVQVYTGSSTSYADRVNLSTDDFQTIEAIDIPQLINARDIIWSEYHKKFFVGANAIGGQNNYFLSSEDGRNWTVYSNVTDWVSDVAVTNTGRIIISKPNARGVAYSDDGGNNFTDVALVGSPNGFNDLLILPNNNIYVFTNGGIYLSEDNAESFTEISHLQMTCAAYSEPLAAIICGSSGDMYRSDDGLSFESLSNIASAPRAVSYIAIKDADIFAATTSVVWHSTDGANYIAKEDTSQYGFGMKVNENIIALESTNSPRISKYWFAYIGCAQSSDNTEPNSLNDFVRIK